MGERKIGYIRVSSFEQNTDRQLSDIVDSLDKVFIDKASGKDTHRPSLEKMLEYAREGDTIIVHSMDRLARNLDDLRKLVNSLTSRNIKIQFVKESLIFTGDENPMSILLLSVMGAFSEFERSLIKERQREGIEIAKKNKVYKGRKKTLSTPQVKEIFKKIEAGEKKAMIARDFKISRETLYQYIRSNIQCVNQ